MWIKSFFTNISTYDSNNITLLFSLRLK